MTPTVTGIQTTTTTIAITTTRRGGIVGGVSTIPTPAAIAPTATTAATAAIERSGEGFLQREIEREEEAGDRQHEGFGARPVAATDPPPDGARLLPCHPRMPTRLPRPRLVSRLGGYARSRRAAFTVIDTIRPACPRPRA